MAQTAYLREALIGGAANALDSVDGSILLNLDFGIVVTNAGSGDQIYFFILDEDSAVSESSPNVIAPDTNPGNKRWILQTMISRNNSPPDTNTISSGVLTVTHEGFYKVTGEGAAADDLNSITGLSEGQILKLAASSDSVTITVKHDGTNINLNAGADFIMDSSKDRIELECIGSNQFVENWRSNNGG